MVNRTSICYRTV